MIESGLMVRFGKLVPGREQKGVDLFAETTEYFGRKLAEGAITYFEPFMFATNDLEYETGFFILKGPDIWKLMEDEEFRVLLDKAFYVIEHLRTDVLTVGEAITDQLTRSAKVRAELGIAA